MNSSRIAPFTVVFALATVCRSATAAAPSMNECIAANERSIVLRNSHELQAARSEALVCAAAGCPAEVREACDSRVKDINGATPTIVFEAADTSGMNASDVAVAIDGRPFASRLDGTAIAADPGEHVFVFSAPLHPMVERRLVLYEGVKNRHERIELGALSTAHGEAVTPADLRPNSQDVTSPNSRGLASRKVAAITLASVGVLGLGVGAAFGASTLSAWSDAKGACGAGGPSHCVTSNPTSVTSERSQAQTDGTVSTVGIVTGGVLVILGATLFFTGGHSEGSNLAVSPDLTHGGGSIALRGRF